MADLRTPWIVKRPVDDGHVMDVFDATGTLIHRGYWGRYETALLIAAAPDLLEALKDYMANGGPNWQDKSCGHAHLCVCSEQAARAAIAKAEGR